MKFSRRPWLDRNGWNNLRARAPRLALVVERLTRKRMATVSVGRLQHPDSSATFDSIDVVELLERWESEDFDDTIPDWHRKNLWRRRAYWARDYVFRF